MTGCPFPGCERPLAAGRHAFFCVDHSLGLRRGELKFLIRMSMGVAAAADDDERRYLREQLDGYVRSAIANAPKIEEAKRAKEYSSVS